MKASFFLPEGDAYRCVLCPHRCLLKPGSRGRCKVRLGAAGGVEIPYAGLISSEAMDPVEKKPLYHFFPGRGIYSVGFWGCNLSCPFCQNWSISQEVREEGIRLDPASLARRAKDSGAFGIAYTYSEPLVHLEFVLEAAAEARRLGLRNVLVSNGCVGAEAAEAVIPLMDAANIDLKAWDAEAYARALGGDLEAVKGFILSSYKRLHLELTTLIVPGLSDSLEDIRAMGEWIASLSKDIPWHLSAYRPEWKYTKPPTSLSSLSAAVQEARRHLRYVYPGNVSSLDENTRCPFCGAILVERHGYEVRIGEYEAGRCTRCGARIPIVDETFYEKSY